MIWQRGSFGAIWHKNKQEVIEARLESFEVLFPKNLRSKMKVATVANLVDAFEDLGFSIDDPKAIDRLVWPKNLFCYRCPLAIASEMELVRFFLI